MYAGCAGTIHSTLLVLCQLLLMRLLFLSVCVRSDMVYVTCMQLLVAWFVLLLNAALLVVSDGAGIVY